MNLVVVGAGYVGAVTAICLAESGHDVTLVEVAAARLGPFKGGRVPFFEPGLDDLFKKVTDANRLHVVGDLQSSIEPDSVFMVCVGTPLSSEGEADLSQVAMACQSIAENAPDAIVVMRSTLPIGSSEHLGHWLGRDRLDRVATNPEFLAQGTAIRDFQAPTRIVIGTVDGRPNAASRAVDGLYSGIDAPRLVTDFSSAEMIKNVANGYLATRLSFINEVADLCEAYGADLDAVVHGVGLDPRIGNRYLRPGIGFGGSCLPKELSNLVRLGRVYGLPMLMLGAANKANDERPAALVDRLERVLGTFQGRSVAFLGLSFKPDTDDTRYSPAIAMARQLLAKGAIVTAHDPAVPIGAPEPVEGLRRTEAPKQAIEGADLTILATEWRQYIDLDWAEMGTKARSRVLFDGRNALDADVLRRAGWWVIRIGDSMTVPGPTWTQAHVGPRPPA
jgi:UDPglucose 6-dehydrogenase